MDNFNITTRNSIAINETNDDSNIIADYVHSLPKKSKNHVLPGIKLSPDVADARLLSLAAQQIEVQRNSI